MSRRVFSWLVRLFPADVREHHGREMEQVLRTLRAEARGPRSAAGFWVATVLDVLRTAPRQHWDALMQDLRTALRGMKRTPGFAAAAVLTIALGTGAASAVFAVVNAVLLRPLAYSDPSHVALVWTVDDRGSRSWLSAPELDDLRQRATTLTGVAGLTDLRLALTGAGEPEELQVVAASASLFPLLGVRPQIGRFFAASDDERGAAPVVLLSHGLWQRRFGGAAAVAGTAIVLDGRAYTVIGVLPADFSVLPPSSVFPARVDAWVPLQPHTPVRDRDVRYLHAIARVPADMAGARRELAAIGSAVSQDFASAYRGRSWTFDLVPMADDIVRTIRPALLALAVTVALVLLIACANVAALLLARGESRRREMAIRAVLGASRQRIVRQLVTEGLVLAVVGGAAGLALAAAVPQLAAIPALAAIPRFTEVSIDWRVLTFALAAALATALLFTVAPALELSRRRDGRAVDVLRFSGRSRAAARATRFLAAGEIALASAVLVVAVLFAGAVARLLEVDLGFAAERRLTFRLSLPPKYATSAEITRFFDRVLERIALAGEVEAAGAVTQLPLSGAMLGSSFTTADGDDRRFDVDLRGATPEYFRALGIALVAGRTFTVADTSATAPVAVIDETLARKLFPARRAIGQRLRWIRQPHVPVEIVGVVRATRHRGFEELPRGTVYRPHTQYARNQMFVVVRTRGDAAAALPAAAAAVHAVDPEQPLADVATMTARVRRALAQAGFGAALAGALAVLALVLAAVGVYGLFAFSVAQQRGEIGVRLALGASSSAILRLIVADGVRLAAVGLAIGFPAALAASRVFRSALAASAAQGAAAFAAAAAVLLAAVSIACWVPARRAARVDPAAVLRAD